ncbi:hypothetical protein BRADI_4g05484v3 [Brachypodium distachyon]|uniref:Uncharacterized protein n=1 Tax=Brachypodium distachyon TaxID=15368 RepID=A0A2K2CKN2_BRADI|nr:hypothetical protein BRADI_4g05484v3 [Brachypodium distachyon]
MGSEGVTGGEDATLLLVFLAFAFLLGQWSILPGSGRMTQQHVIYYGRTRDVSVGPKLTFFLGKLDQHLPFLGVHQ